MENRLLYTMALGYTRGIGPITAKALVDHFGHAEKLYQFLETDINQLSGFGQRIIRRIREEQRRAVALARREQKRVESSGIEVVGHWDPRFPRRLWQCPDSPLIVYTIGKPLYNRERTVCILGSEACSRYGKQILKYLLKRLKPYGVTVICGGDSVWDIDVMEQSIAQQISVTSVLSEETLLHQARPHSSESYLSAFSGAGIDRPGMNTISNRMRAGLSDLCIVIEASKFDQALKVADIANQYNRDVAAFPGRIWSDQGFGTNLLIKSHRAALISSIHDISYVTGWTPQT